MRSIYEKHEKIALNLARSLSDYVESMHGAYIFGSWSNCEAHLPLACNTPIHSFSDIDIVIRKPPTELERNVLKMNVLRLVLQHGVRADKVSIRQSSEISALWSPVWGCGTNASKFIYLMFWVLLGAYEIASEPVFDSTEKRAYYLVKYLFKCYRNLLLTNFSTTCISYAELARIISVELNGGAMIYKALGVKTGRIGIINDDECDYLLDHCMSVMKVNNLNENVDDGILYTTFDEIRNWYKSGYDLNSLYYLDAMRHLDMPPALHPAYQHAFNKYEQFKLQQTA